jgi:bifunctional enzyme CysN/CysC
MDSVIQSGERGTPSRDLSAADLEAYLSAHEKEKFLRLLTCSSVDDGKSTLIGALLQDVSMPFADEPTAFADGKQSGRIDIAFSVFSIDRQKFIVADTPGHEHYTCNMATGAWWADAAIMLVDARKGVVPQTRRDSYLVSLFGIRHVVLAVNKMDLVQYSAEEFAAIESTYCGFAAQLGLEHVTCIPLSALRGDNVVAPSNKMRWYQGPPLRKYLETLKVEDRKEDAAPFRLPVQEVIGPPPELRAFGTVAGGTVRPGDRIRVQPSGRESRVVRIASHHGDLALARAGQAITLTLADNVEVNQGDVISSAEAPAEVADQFEATLVWTSDQPMLPGRPYWLKIGAKTVTATIARLKYKVNVNTLEHAAARKLELNEIGTCTCTLDQPIAFDPYRVCRDTGGFTLVDRTSNDTVGAGLLHFALRRSQNIHWQAVDVNKRGRATQKEQQPCILWFTGLSAAGKSTIANLVERMLHASGFHTYLLDGDNVRHGLNKDLGFTEEDRVENIRRIAEVGRLMVDAGLIVLVAFISPFRAERRMARSLVEEREFIEIFVDAPLEVAEQRDPKGLYRKARRGELKNFTGIDSPYEPPEHAEIRIDTTASTPQSAAELVISALRQRDIISGH